MFQNSKMFSNLTSQFDHDLGPTDADSTLTSELVLIWGLSPTYV